MKDTEWVKLTRETFEFATYAKKEFATGGLEPKKEILSSLGESPVIKRGKFVIEPHDSLLLIKNNYPPLEEEYLRLELDKKPLNKAKTEALASVRQRWLPG